MLIRGKYKEVQELRHQEESRQQRICKAKEDLAAAELELSNLPPYEHPKDKYVSFALFSQTLTLSGALFIVKRGLVSFCFMHLVF